MQIEPNPQEEIRTELKFDSGKILIVLFPRARSQVAMPAWIFGDCREGQMRQPTLELSNKNVGLNKTEKAVLGLLLEDSDRTADLIATEIGVTKRTIECTFVSLQKKVK